MKRDPNRIWYFHHANKKLLCSRCFSVILKHDLVARSGRKYLCCECHENGGKRK